MTTAGETTALAPHGAKYDADQVALIRRMIAPNASADELNLFVQVCQRTGLDPLARQIYCIHRGGKMGIQTSIDGFRLIAERNGHYAGQLGPLWCGEDGAWQDVWLSSKPPAACKVAVLRSDFKEPLWAVANFSFYVQSGPMWQKGGPHMLAKCAEALALRKAFPQELSGLYTGDEMDQAAPEYSPPKASADQTPKAPAGATTTSRAPTAESPPTSGAIAAPKPSPRANTVKHTGELASAKQVTLLHTLRGKVGGLVVCDPKEPCPYKNGTLCGYHKQLAAFKDQAGNPVRSSKDLSPEQISNLIDRYEKKIAEQAKRADAGFAGAPSTAVDQIRKAMERGPLNEQELCAYFNVDSLAELPQEQQGTALALVLHQGTARFVDILEELQADIGARP